MRYELAETLTQVLECVTVPTPPGFVITAAEIELPLEISPVVSGASLVFFGSAAHSRWKAGFLPDVHLARLRVEVFEAPET